MYVVLILFLFILDKFMSEEIAEYEIGKRHVANIMGLDPETITQEDIDVGLSIFIFYCHLVLTDRRSEFYYVCLQLDCIVLVSW